MAWYQTKLQAWAEKAYCLLLSLTSCPLKQQLDSLPLSQTPPTYQVDKAMGSSEIFKEKAGSTQTLRR